MARRFITVAGGIFVDEGRNTNAKILKSRENDGRPICHAENEHNHFHFDYEFSADRWDSFLRNRAFAEAAKVAWDETLRGRRQKQEYRLIVCNQLTAVEACGGTGSYHIYPTLILWTKGPGTSDLDRLLCVEDLSPDNVWVYEERPAKTYIVSLKKAKAFVDKPPWLVEDEDL